MPYINATFYDSSAVIHYNGQWPDGFPNFNQLILKTIITKQLLCSYKVALFELTEGEKKDDDAYCVRILPQDGKPQ